MSDIITPFCTLEWAEKFFLEFIYNEYWSGSSREKKLSALKTASTFINDFVTFYDENSDPVFYRPDGESDFDNVTIPLNLKRACAQEAEYLLSLDDNPAAPHPLTILGMISADGKHFDKDMAAPIFTKGVVRLLISLNAEVDPDAVSIENIQVKSFTNTY